MNTTPVIVLLLFDAVLLLAANLSTDKAWPGGERLVVTLLFFCSGMPALIYQIVWQRALFAIYGVNAESVAVVVSAFMMGLGLGSLLGGWLSSRFPRHGILLFGVAEFGVASFGLVSLQIFHWAATYTAGASLPWVIVFSLLLLLVPTLLMGATLPLLVEHLVVRSGRVGASVSTLYFVNTFGSAVACCLCAVFLLRDSGQSGSVTVAACVNTLVGVSAYLYAKRSREGKDSRVSAREALTAQRGLPLVAAALIAGITGFIALGFEIAWFRVYSLASSDRAPAFALLLSTYLAGIAAGAYLSERLMEGRAYRSPMGVIGVFLLVAGGLSPYLPPLVALLMAEKMPFLASAPAFFVVAGLAGSVLPLVCQLSISPDAKSGRAVSFVYVSNIIGSALGSLLIGFVWMQYFGLREISMQLGLAAIVAGSAVLVVGKEQLSRPSGWRAALFAAPLLALAGAYPLYPLLFERLIFGKRSEARAAFAHVVENRNGVIGVTQDAAVFGGGVYDGHFNVDPTSDINLVVRAYALSAFHPAPKRMLMVGLASGSWGQIFANHPQLESLDVVEINPGYVQLIPLYPVVRSLLQNPKTHIYIDDGRRWLLAHPDAKYDAIIANTSFHWRDHSSGLLSVEFLQLIRAHLNSGGVYYFNTTESDETMATALHVYPYGLRVINFLAVSDSPIRVDKERWLSVMRGYAIDGQPVLDPANPKSKRILAAYGALVDTLQEPPRFMGFESGDSLRGRLEPRTIITDDNMGWEWRSGISIPWH